MKVNTIKGEIEYSDLEIKDLVEIGDNHRKITTEYRHNGEVVRSDVVVNFFRPFDMTATHGVVNG